MELTKSVSGRLETTRSFMPSGKKETECSFSAEVMSKSAECLDPGRILRNVENSVSTWLAQGTSSDKQFYPFGDPMHPLLAYSGEGLRTLLQQRIDSQQRIDRQQRNEPHIVGKELSNNKVTAGKRPTESLLKNCESYVKTNGPQSQICNPRHDSHLVHAIRQLHQEEFGLDVVLLASGGHIGAHCAVLAAASPFLKNLLLDASDHPAIISVAGTSLSTLKALVSCMYTGTTPPGVNLKDLCELAQLLQMDSLVAAIRRVLTTPTQLLLESTSQRSHAHEEVKSVQRLSALVITHEEGKSAPPGHKSEPETSGKKNRSNRLDQILYHKLNANHLAPFEAETMDISDQRGGGILGELLTKTSDHPVNRSFSALMTSSAAQTEHPVVDGGSRIPLKPLNLTKCEKGFSVPQSTYPSMSATSSSLLGLNTSLVSNFPSLLPTLNSSYLASFMSPSALMQTTASIVKQSRSGVTSNNNSVKYSSATTKSKATAMKGNSSKNLPKLSNHSAIPLLYALQNSSPEAAKKMYEQLKQSPQWGLMSELRLNNLQTAGGAANSHLTMSKVSPGYQLPTFHPLFPFLSSQPDLSRTSSSEIAARKSDHPDPTVKDEALNLTSGAETPPTTVPPTQEMIDSLVAGGVISAPTIEQVSASESSVKENYPKEELTGAINSNSLPVLKNEESCAITEKKAGFLVAEELPTSTPESSFLSLDITEKPLIPICTMADELKPSDNSSLLLANNLSSSSSQVKKTMFYSGHMGRKRKGCGECEGCQVVEDCSQCRFCRDKAKFGGPNRLKQVCLYKRCIHFDFDSEDPRKRKKSCHKKLRAKCGECDGCQRTSDCTECYSCLHNLSSQPPARRRVCEMRVCEQQQIEEVRASLNVAEEPSPYSTDSLHVDSANFSSGTSSPTSDTLPNTHNDKMKLMRKMLKKKFAAPFSKISPSKVRTKYYCGECPGCQTNVPCGNCLYCEDMPKFGGPGRYRQKCVKQLCVYHPRLQALKLSNRLKDDDEPSGPEGGPLPVLQEEEESLPEDDDEGVEEGDEGAEGDDSNHSSCESLSQNINEVEVKNGEVVEESKKDFPDEKEIVKEIIPEGRNLGKKRRVKEVKDDGDTAPSSMITNRPIRSSRHQKIPCYMMDLDEQSDFDDEDLDEVLTSSQLCRNSRATKIVAREYAIVESGICEGKLKLKSCSVTSEEERSLDKESIEGGHLKEDVLQ